MNTWLEYGVGDGASTVHAPYARAYGGSIATGGPDRGVPRV
jgi:hypothetical protein